MTRKEFEKLRMSIEEQTFIGNCADPIEYGIQRAAFEKLKFQKLITAARKVNMRTTRAKADQWQRQFERAQHSYERFKELRKDIAGIKVQIQIDPAFPPANGKTKSGRSRR